ncbi:MAG: hypothetical protein ACRDVD_03480 [Acidimicrobiia bacterium]
MKRTFAILATSACLVISLASTALGGGWAVASFDEAPAGFEAGTTYTLGYTIRAHGVSAVDAGTTEIRFVGPTETLVFEGVPDQTVGHYTAQITVPAAGEWHWEVTMGAYPTQDLGTISVTPPSAGIATAPNGAMTALRVVLPLATLLTFALAVLQFRRLAVVTTRPAVDVR